MLLAPPTTDSSSVVKMVQGISNILLPILVGAIMLTIGWRRNEIALVFNLIDHPDGMRKVHDAPTPLVGGLMFLACALILIGLNYFWMVNDNQHDQRLYLVAAIIIPHGILGMTDDRYSVPAAARLTYSLSLIAAVLATDRTLVMRTYYFSFGLSFELSSQLSYMAIVLFIVFFVYAVNMIDGLNGVLAIYGVILLGVFSVWLLRGSEVYFLCALITLSIFLAFNLAGAIFAGDGGSYIIGASAAVLFLHLYEQAFDTRSFPIDMIVVAAFVPGVDAIRVSLARWQRGASIFSADRNHLHHILSDRFCTTKALVAYSIVAAFPVGIAVLNPKLTWAGLIAAVTLYSVAIYSPIPRTHRPSQ